jgi:hypothetical protein
MKNDNSLAFVLLAIAGMFVWKVMSQSQTSGQTPAGAPSMQSGMINCKYPDGSVVPMPASGNCPFDGNRGGQSTPCYPSDFIGPPPTGAGTC